MNSVSSCSICFSSIKESQKKTLRCSGCHSFHQKCIWPWIIKYNTCPLCRDVVSDLPEYKCPFNEYIHFINACSNKYK